MEKKNKINNLNQLIYTNIVYLYTIQKHTHKTNIILIHILIKTKKLVHWIHVLHLITFHLTPNGD